MKKMFTLVLALALLFTMSFGNVAFAGQSAKDEVVAGVTSLSTAIDPLLANFNTAASIGQHIYNTLVAYDKDNVIVPEMATQWERIDDLTWSFTVDLANYTFHTGDPVTMDDIVFSITRCFDIPQAMDHVANITSVTAKDNQIIITTDKPSNKVIHGLTNIVITSQKAMEAAGDNWGQIAVGTGPYKLVSFVPLMK